MADRSSHQFGRQGVGFHHLILTALVVSFFLFPAAAGDNNEPTVRVDVPDRWRSATVSVYIFNMPWDGQELSDTSITVKIAVWGADEDNPVYIRLDGEDAARITSQGMFTYSWELMGSHHLLIRDDYVIFNQAGFNIEAPPPPEPVIQYSRFTEALETQFKEVVERMLVTAIIGVALGVQAKKYTRKKADIGLLAFAMPLIYGGLNMADWYILVSFGAAGAVTYWLIPDFGDRFGLGSIDTGSWIVREITLDKNGFVLDGVGLKYWRDRFIKHTPIKFSQMHLTTFVLPSGILQGVVVKSRKQESDGTISIEVDASVSELLIRAEAFDEMKEMLQETKTELLKEQALNTIRKEKEIKQRTKENIHTMFQGREADVTKAEERT